MSGAALFKAGANVSTSLTEAQYDYAILQAEGKICAETKFNWIDKYASLGADVKYILEEVCSNLAAIYLITYDMSGYTSRAEAQSMIDVLYAMAKDGLKKLKEKYIQTFMINA